MVYFIIFVIHRFNLEGRYPDYNDLLYKECNEEFTEQLFNSSC